MLVLWLEVVVELKAWLELPTVDDVVAELGLVVVPVEVDSDGVVVPVLDVLDVVDVLDANEGRDVVDVVAAPVVLVETDSLVDALELDVAGSEVLLCSVVVLEAPVVLLNVKLEGAWLVLEVRMLVDEIVVGAENERVKASQCCVKGCKHIKLNSLTQNVCALCFIS